MNRNYMVIHPKQGQNESYMIRMLNGNKISGLLSFQEKQVDGDVMFYYDITSKQPLNRVLEKRSLTAGEFRGLICDFIFTLRQMERFLLDEGQLCLKPEHIYVEPDTFHGSFCLIPGKRGDFSMEFCELAQYLLDHVNHSDGEAVVLAFSVFRECRKDNFGIDDIERCMGETDEKGMGTVGPTERRIEESVPEQPEWEWDITQKSMVKNQETQEKKQNDSFLYRRGAARWRRTAAGGIVSGMILVPAITFRLMGTGGFLQWSKEIFACELLLAALLAAALRRSETAEPGKKLESEKGAEGIGPGEEELWKVYFNEMDECGETERQSRTENSKDADSEENMKTVLLTAAPVYQETRSLAPIDGGPEIPIGYYPFLIGKNKDLSDFFLNEDGVSRLHVKIDKTEDGYSVTDLNSTNGTRVNGELLEANETRSLPLGSELAIAAVRYRFR